MAYSPDQPFPKTPGNPIMAKDWNDAVAEVQRLEPAKVNKLVPDNMTGPLSIGAALGMAAPAGARLHVEDNVTPVIARMQSTAASGVSRLEMWSDQRNGQNEWRPCFIETLDQGNFTGGLRFVTNGTGAGSKQGSVEAFRVVNGMSGFGVTNPAYRIDALGPIRSRNNGGVTSGLWLNQPSGDRAFVGMLSDTVFGVMGNAGAGWSLQMDVVSGNLGVRTAPTAGNALTASGNAYVTGNIGAGVASPTQKLDTLGPIRSRNNGGITAGTWLFQSTPNADRAFVGMMNDNVVGFFGNGGAGWSLQMDVTNGAITCMGSLTANSNQTVGGTLTVNGNQTVGGNVTAARMWATSNVHTEVRASNYVTWNADWTPVPNMSVTFTLATSRPVWVCLHLPNVRVTAGAGGTWTANFRLLLNGGYFASVTPYFIANQFASNEVNITRLVVIGAGTWTLSAEWAVGANGSVMHLCETGAGAFGERCLQVVEL